MTGGQDWANEAYEDDREPDPDPSPESWWLEMAIAAALLAGMVMALAMR